MKHEKIRATLAVMPIRSHWFHHHPGGSHHLPGGYISASVNRIDPAICHIPTTAGIAAAKANAAFVAACNPAAIAALLEDCDALTEALEEIIRWTEQWAAVDHPIATVARKALAAYRNGGES